MRTPDSVVIARLRNENARLRQTLTERPDQVEIRRLIREVMSIKTDRDAAIIFRERTIANLRIEISALKTELEALGLEEVTA
jgi:hypothetical protein